MAQQKNPIRITQALEILNSTVSTRNPRACHIVFCTADRSRNTGGQRIIFDRAALLRPLNKGRKTEKNSAPGGSTHTRRYPVNVKNVTSGEIRRVHLDLIESINHHPII